MEANPAAAVAAPALLIVADDLIWASRLHAAAERAGARGHIVANIDALTAELAGAGTRAGTRAGVVIVDLGGKRYDGIAAVRLAAAAGAVVLAVGQHDDADARRMALAAGARRVFSYNKMFSDGARVAADLIAGRF